jgi:16S rRNA (cytosine967-C5)-methyltransferase
MQDIGAQSIVPLLRLEPGQWYLDLCAAPGNKTAQALEAGVRAIACDRRFDRLVQLKEMGCPLVVLDGTRPLPFGRCFDRILVDAPCSGSGTLGRNPEIKWRLRPADLEELPRRQTALLANARAALAPGGLLVYSTCSLEPEENGAVVAGGPADLVLDVMLRLPGRDAGDGFYAAVIKSEQPANG